MKIISKEKIIDYILNNTKEATTAYDISIVEDMIDELIDIQKANSYKKALNDMFLRIAELSQGDDEPFNRGELSTNLDEIFRIKEDLVLKFNK